MPCKWDTWVWVATILFTYIVCREGYVMIDGTVIFLTSHFLILFHRIWNSTIPSLALPSFWVWSVKAHYNVNEMLINNQMKCIYTLFDKLKSLLQVRNQRIHPSGWSCTYTTPYRTHLSSSPCLQNTKEQKRYFSKTQTQTRREHLKTSAELTFAYHSVQNGPELMNWNLHVLQESLDEV